LEAISGQLAPEALHVHKGGCEAGCQGFILVSRPDSAQMFGNPPGHNDPGGKFFVEILSLDKIGKVGQ
jgi:hypothetical protein